MTSSDAKPDIGAPHDDTWQVLGELTLPSEPDHERLPVNQVVETLRGLNLPITCLERLQQRVNEDLRNVMQHENQYGPEAPVLVRVLTSNIEPRQIEQQSPSGWGFFLIERTTQTSSGLARRAIELFMYREGGKDEHKSD